MEKLEGEQNHEGKKTNPSVGKKGDLEPQRDRKRKGRTSRRFQNERRRSKRITFPVAGKTSRDGQRFKKEYKPL